MSRGWPLALKRRTNGGAERVLAGIPLSGGKHQPVPIPVGTDRNQPAPMDIGADRKSRCGAPEASPPGVRIVPNLPAEQPGPSVLESPRGYKSASGENNNAGNRDEVHGPERCRGE
ncbi:MAG: hypothetical protein A3H69_06070 [Candidatus Sungbacteria bacterium RIFCSPLOWO2_02_FULL_47_9]|nr:MAG: hypothetical protein A3D57_01405 [Candidatus Sungbacteria bacterium RIFCSPHIGHO2_02_FULL_46_12]OHA09567.1 MAG: hypothetical protein A3H69_06070 [Candidatus Sungbacteria bacterium RIFCSPLOWO2_02_FULL_47_9]